MDKKKLQEAEEQIKTALLYMNYNSSKTLTENKEEIKNKKVISEQTTTQALGSAAGGLLARGAGATMAASLATTLGATGTAVPIVGTAAGIIIGYGLGTLIDWAANHDYGEEGFREVMKACSAKGVSKLVPQLSKSDVRQIAYSIEDAKGQWNDDENAIASALAKIPTIADLCAVDKKIPGGLAEFLDNLTDSPDEWKMFTRPLAGMIEDTEIMLTPEEQGEEENTTEWNKYPCVPSYPGAKKTNISTGGVAYLINGEYYYANGRKKTSDGKMVNFTCDDPLFKENSGGGGGGTTYKPCTGTYKQNCKSEKIREVQRCLGMPPKYQTGNFGPITFGYLERQGKGFQNGFTDADVSKICGNTLAGGGGKRNPYKDWQPEETEG